MSSESWQADLRTAISLWQRPPKIALLGIGHELRGDDAAGMLAARALANATEYLVIDAGSSPENHTGALRRFSPDLVLMIDAAQMSRAPGEIRLFDPGAVDGFSANTHTLPLSLVTQYLRGELGCIVLGIGIQPRNTEFGEPVSDEVQRAVDQIVQELRSILASP